MNYRAFGAASSVSYGNNRKTNWSYDTDLMRMTQMEVAKSDGTEKLLWNSYAYTKNGLLSGISDYTDSTYTASYEYNYRNQL